MARPCRMVASSIAEDTYQRQLPLSLTCGQPRAASRSHFTVKFYHSARERMRDVKDGYKREDIFDSFFFRKTHDNEPILACYTKIMFFFSKLEEVYENKYFRLLYFQFECFTPINLKVKILMKRE